MKTKSEEIRIERIIVKVAGHTLHLSIEQASGLKKALEDLFGKETIIKHEYDYRPWPIVWRTNSGTNPYGGMDWNGPIYSSSYKSDIKAAILEVK